MQWTLLNHTGPSLVTLSTSLSDDYCVLRTKRDKGIILDNIQRYLVYLYYKNHYLKVDPVFQKNFWKSLLCSDSITSDSQVDIMCPESKRPESFMHTERARAYMVLANGVVFDDWVGSIESQPSIFVGRDPSHPKRGMCRRGVRPQDVVLNMTCNEHNKMHAKRRGFVRFVENKQAKWIANWEDPITNEKRYLFIHSSSAAQRLDKFDKARLLKRRMRLLHTKQANDIVSPSENRRQIALAVFLLDHLCIRVGNEKDVMTEADTIGCCTLKAHSNIFVKNIPKKTICLQFIGKDSVPFKKTVVIPEPYFSQCVRMLDNRLRDALFFDRISPSSINRYIHSIAPGCSAKTFRTLKASTTFQSCLQKTNDIKQANQKVACLLNHMKGPQKNKVNTETSKRNYIDPRVYIAHCKRNGVKPSNGWISPDDPLFQNTLPTFRF
jgi:hypothetical protein